MLCRGVQMIPFIVTVESWGGTASFLIPGKGVIENN